MAAGLVDCHLLARLSAVRIYQTVSCDNHKCHERVIFCDGVPEMPEAWHGTETGVLHRDTRHAWLSTARAAAMHCVLDFTVRTLRCPALPPQQSTQ